MGITLCYASANTVKKSFIFFGVLIISNNISKRRKMTPEELKEFVEQCETKFANRYSDKDPEYKRVAATVQSGGTPPPMIASRPRQHYDQDRNNDHHRGGGDHHHRNRDHYRRDDHRRGGGDHHRDRSENRHHHNRY